MVRDARARQALAREAVDEQLPLPRAHLAGRSRAELGQQDVTKRAVIALQCALRVSALAAALPDAAVIDALPPLLGERSERRACSGALAQQRLGPLARPGEPRERLVDVRIAAA
jgi:hypothetical protein